MHGTQEMQVLVVQRDGRAVDPMEKIDGLLARSIVEDDGLRRQRQILRERREAPKDELGAIMRDDDDRHDR